MKKFLILVSLCFIASSLMAEPIVIKFSHVVSENTPKGQGALLFKKLVEERLAGRVVVQVFPNALLYSDTDEINGLLTNEVQLIAPSISKLIQYNPELSLFDLPFLFKDFNSVVKYWRRDISRELLSPLANNGFVGLDFWGNGMKQMTATREIRLPSDAAGLKFRIQDSEILKREYEVIGAAGIPAEFSNSFTALKNGIVQGTENTWSNIYTQNYQDVQSNMTETNHGVIGYILVTNRTFWAQLPFDVKVELNEIIHEVTDTVNNEAIVLNNQALQKLIDSNKSTILTLNESEKDAWKEAYASFLAIEGSHINRSVLRAAEIVNR